MFRDESQQVVRKAKNTAPARRAAKVSKRTTTTDAHPSTPSPREKTASASPSGDDKSLQSLQGTPPLEDNASDLTVPSESSPDRQTLARPVHDKQRTQVLQQLEQQQTDQPVVNVQPSYYPTQDEAVCYFLRYNAWPGAFWMLNATPDLFLQKSGSTSLQAMKAGVVSVGMAMLSRIRRSRSLKLGAEKEYGNALRLMNTAVSDVREARANPTLAAVLLLAIFEVITSRAPRNIENWINHIRGAAALLELRGVEQLQDSDGLRLFVQLRYQIVCFFLCPFSLNSFWGVFTNSFGVDRELSATRVSGAAICSGLLKTCNVSAATARGVRRSFDLYHRETVQLASGHHIQDHD